MDSGIVSYYRTRAVLRRIVEYLGVSPDISAKIAVTGQECLAENVMLKQVLCRSTAEYIAAYGRELLQTTGKDHASFKVFSLGRVLDQGLDVHRSVWDRERMLFVLDMEYFSRNFPGEPFLNPARVFKLLEPVYRAILDILASYSIHPVCVVTGQGYNFVFTVSKDSSEFTRLVSLGSMEPTLGFDYQHPSPLRGRPVPDKDALAFDAAGKIMEFFSHRVFLLLNESGYQIPVMTGDVVPGNERREGVSFDLSLYTHPLHTRSFRCPFSVYSKHLLKGHILGEHVIRQAGPLFCILRRVKEREVPLARVLKIRSDAAKSAQQAARMQVTWEDQSQGLNLLMTDYESSPLYGFHKEYDSIVQDECSRWLWGYNRFDLDSIPPCAAMALKNPNPMLLQPTHLRTIVRVLMAAGWHPKHIAGLIYSKYVCDFKWEVDFRRYDANRWANVWVRNFAGMILCRVDSCEDMNCPAQQKKGESWAGMDFCPSGECRFSLEHYRDLLSIQYSRV